MNFNTSFKQQYPHLLQPSQSPLSNDLTSLNSQQDFLSLPMTGLLKNDKIPSTDQEKLNDVISQTRRWVFGLFDAFLCKRFLRQAITTDWMLFDNLSSFSRRCSNTSKLTQKMCSWHETKCHFIAFSLKLFSLFPDISVSTICWSTTHLVI